MRKVLIKGGLLAALALTLSMGHAAGKNEIKPQKTPGGIEYVSGGVGQSRSTTMESMRKDYNFRLTFARPKTGAYLADVKLNVVDVNSNKPVIEGLSVGPMFFANLPAGKYAVTAESEGVAQTKRTTVAEGRPRGMVFYFAKP